MKPFKLISRSALGVAMLAALAACGGGGTGEPVPPLATNEVPASATASPAAYSQYAAAATSSEIAEPLSVAKVMAPTSETDEPIEVN